MMDALQTSSPEEFNEKALEVIVKHIRHAQSHHGSCMLGLSGGSTPRPVYEELGKRTDIDWGTVTIFLVDERCVPPDDPESNQKMIRETLLRHAPIPEERMFFPDTTLPPQECADSYSMALVRMTDQRLPDLTILGMGEDGHIASLFPPLHDELYGESRMALHTMTDRFAVHDRISVGLNFIAAAPAHVILLKGEGKKKTWEDMLASPEDEKRWPLKAVLDERNEVTVVFG